jgi:hypothetical protein
MDHDWRETSIVDPEPGDEHPYQVKPRSNVTRMPTRSGSWPGWELVVTQGARQSGCGHHTMIASTAPITTGK